VTMPCERRIQLLLAALLLAATSCHSAKSPVSAKATPAMAASSLPSATVTASPSSTPSRVSLQRVDWSTLSYPVEYPQNCPVSGTLGSRFLGVVYATPQPGTTVALVLANCNLGAGTPPEALFMYDSAPSSSTPHLAQVLFNAHDGWLAAASNTNSAISVNGPGVSLAVAGYPTGQGFGGATPGPTVRTTLSWTWQGSQYHETSQEPAHARLPS
jgi:hypothetical protein